MTETQEKMTEMEAKEQKKASKKRKHSRPSERAISRMGMAKELRERPRQEVFSIKNTRNRHNVDVSPQRMADFWRDVAKRQRAALKMAGVSTIPAKISSVRIITNKDGEEVVKVAFAGGGSFLDAGNALSMMYDIRKTMPQPDRLQWLLQMLREKGWKAIEGENIPEELKTKLKEIAKAQGIPMEVTTKGATQKTPMAPSAVNDSPDKHFASIPNKNEHMTENKNKGALNIEYANTVDKLRAAEKTAKTFEDKKKIQQQKSEANLEEGRRELNALRKKDPKINEILSRLENGSEQEKKDLKQIARNVATAGKAGVSAEQVVDAYLKGRLSEVMKEANKILTGNANKARAEQFGLDWNSLDKGARDYLCKVIKLENGDEKKVKSLVDQYQNAKTEEEKKVLRQGVERQLAEKNKKQDFDMIMEMMGMDVKFDKENPDHLDIASKAKKLLKENLPETEKNKIIEKIKKTLTDSNNRGNSEKGDLNKSSEKSQEKKFEDFCRQLGLPEKEIEELKAASKDKPRKKAINQALNYKSFLTKKGLTKDEVLDSLKKFIDLPFEQRRTLLKEASSSTKSMEIQNTGKRSASVQNLTAMAEEESKEVKESSIEEKEGDIVQETNIFTEENKVKLTAMAKAMLTKEPTETQKLMLARLQENGISSKEDLKDIQKLNFVLNNIGEKCYSTEEWDAICAAQTAVTQQPTEVKEPAVKAQPEPEKDKVSVAGRMQEEKRLADKALLQQKRLQYLKARSSEGKVAPQVPKVARQTFEQHQSQR